MSNLSQQRTKKIILESFGELLTIKSFSEITMTEIAAKALVHRNTVYKYFNDKYDLLSQGVTFLFENQSINLGNFKQQPFKSIHDVYFSALEEILTQQQNDHNFNKIIQNNFIELLITTQKDDNIFWDIGKMAGILLWNEMHENKYDMFNDYQILDNIYQTEEFPENN